MDREIRIDDYKRFEQFEEKLLSLKDSGIVYKKEDALEIEIKKEALFSHFGKEPTTEMMEKLKLNFEDLINQEFYIEIYKILSSK
jgi:hypothetical protein